MKQELDPLALAEPGRLGEPYFQHDIEDRTLLYACNNWSCKACGPKRAKHLKRGIIQACIELGLKYMYTLTAPAPMHKWSSIESRGRMSEMFHALITRLKANDRRKKPGIRNYIHVFEAHKSGVCHIHFAADYYFTKRELEAAWLGLGGGFVKSSKKNRKLFVEGQRAEDVHAPHQQEVPKDTTERVGRYLAKYISKGVGQTEMPWDAFVDMKDGTHRKKPWHRWGANRFTAMQVRHHAGIRLKLCSACELPRNGLSPLCPNHPVSEWSLLKMDNFGDIVPAFVHLDHGGRIPNCKGHSYGQNGRDCHDDCWSPVRREPECGISLWIDYGLMRRRLDELVSIVPARHDERILAAYRVRQEVGR